MRSLGAENEAFGRLTNDLDLSYPFAVIDFEASSLEESSFPIEVGVAIARSATNNVEVWSALIRPDASWDLFGGWDPDAERVHRITRRDLAGGLSPGDVMKRLNALLGSIEMVWCGDRKYDPLWLRRLSDAAGAVAPDFTMRPVADLDGPDGPVQACIAEQLAATSPPHRAGPDAERLCRAVMRVLHLYEGNANRAGRSPDTVSS